MLLKIIGTGKHTRTCNLNLKLKFLVTAQLFLTSIISVFVLGNSRVALTIPSEALCGFSCKQDTSAALSAGTIDGGDSHTPQESRRTLHDEADFSRTDLYCLKPSDIIASLNSIDTIESCSLRCLSAPGCEAFRYEGSNGTCTLGAAVIDRELVGDSGCAEEELVYMSGTDGFRAFSYDRVNLHEKTSVFAAYRPSLLHAWVQNEGVKRINKKFFACVFFVLKIDLMPICMFCSCSSISA